MEYNLIYYKKYIKYKNRYINLRNLCGGNPFLNVKYLSSGAENMGFDIGNNQVLRIRKDCEKLQQTEIEILNKIIINSPRYFVKIYKIGSCKDLKTKFENKESVTEICNNISGDLCDYTYVIMENANGINIIDYILKYLDNTFTKINDTILNLEDNDTRVLLNDLIIYLLQIFEKICDGLIDAQSKIPKFYHGDLNYRNVFINDSTLDPTIFDFGASSDKINNNSLDILNYIKDIYSNIPDLIKHKSDIFKQNIKNIMTYILDTFNFNDNYNVRIDSNGFKKLNVKQILSLQDFKQKLKDNQCSVLKENLIIQNKLIVS